MKEGINMEKNTKSNRTLLQKFIAGIIISVILAGLAIYLLRDDSRIFFTWWLAIWILGCSFMPLTSILFSTFQDKGWMFSKVLSFGISGYITWLLSSLGIIKFTTMSCIGVVVLCIAANLILAALLRRQNRPVWPVQEYSLIFLEEVVLFLAFLFWTYAACFHPQASYATEHYMDFGFLQAMMRSTEFPVTDIWYSEEPINYYYGGQYYAAFLTKLTMTQAASSYNLMRTLLAGIAFALPFSTIRQVAADYFGKSRRLPVLAGVLAGAAVSFAGNMHYIIFYKILPFFQTPEKNYWFSNSTRYIGCNGENIDSTIHEFPSYSFVLGDLHAHVVNTCFVVMITGILYAWLKQDTYEKKKLLLQWPLLICGIFFGIFQWTNAWDFAIYYVIACGVCFFGNLARFHDWKQGIGYSAAQWVEMLILSFLPALPFTLHFDSSMAQGIRLAQHHSPFYQLCILWALPAVLVIFFLLKLFLEQRKCKPLQWLAHTKKPDIFIAVLGLCALGLILMPELIYLRDIYEQGYARANTMFKLTYQAFILFGTCMGFILVRFLTDRTHKWIRIVGIIGSLCLCLTFGYTPTAINQFYGGILDRDNYQGLDATAFLETEYPYDEPAIRWLQSHVKGQPVVLEANGYSYTNYNRVSAMTGLPTILGAYTHEQLWRGDVEDLNEKSADIETIYTSADKEQVLSLLKQYQVSYIFIGQMEKEKYPALNESLLRSLGTAVFDDVSTIIMIKK